MNSIWPKMLKKFWKMIYAFEKRKSFSEDTRRIRPLLNDTGDLHVQVVDHHRNLASIEIR
jgi:hypothetical protein